MGRFIACLLGGWFGLHKFMEGKVGMGILYLFTGGLLGIGWLVDCIIYLVKWLNKPKPAAVVNSPTPAAVSASIEIVDTQPVEITPEEYDRMRQMCIDIHNEYKDLLKKYSHSKRTYILRECYRKLTVMETIINKYDCYEDIFIYDEFEKIEKKARAFINSYIKEERESGADDYTIDIIKFTDDLDFISDYIYEKDEKLNKI